MQYITGIYALNLPCALDTTGDWHTSSLNWRNVCFADSEQSVFGEYGIEQDKNIPDHNGRYYVANHIRAILDLLSQKQFAKLGNFKNDFICSEKYTQEIFSKVMLLLPDQDIFNFMWKIYGKEWHIWIGEHNTETL